MADILDAQVLLYGRLVATKHGRPVEGAADDDAPEAVAHSWVRVHVEELEAAAGTVILPDDGPAASLDRAPDDDQQKRAHEDRRLKRVRHYHGFHAALRITRDKLIIDSLRSLACPSTL